MALAVAAEEGDQVVVEPVEVEVEARDQEAGSSALWTRCADRNVAAAGRPGKNVLVVNDREAHSTYMINVCGLTRGLLLHCVAEILSTPCLKII